MHTLLLPSGGESAGPARRAAECVARAAPELRRRGARLLALRVRPADLRDPRVRAALDRRGVGRLPALLAGRRALVGCEAIADYCRGLLAEEAPPPEGDPADGADLAIPASFLEGRGSGGGPTGDGRDDAADDGGGSDAATEDLLESFYREGMRAGRDADADEMGFAPGV